MPIVAGWLTGTQVAQEAIEQTLTVMGKVLTRHGGTVAQRVQHGAGFIAVAEAGAGGASTPEAALLDWLPEQRTFSYRRPLSGLHPLYYIENWPAQGNLLFASEIKVLLALGVPRKLNIAALPHLLATGMIPPPWTLFKDISIVPPGSLLRWQRTKTMLTGNTDFSFVQEPLPLSVLMAQLEERLTQFSTKLTPEPVAALVNNSHAAMLPAYYAAREKETLPIAAFLCQHDEDSPEWQQLQYFADECEQPLLVLTGVDQPDYWGSTILGLETPVTNTRALAQHEIFHTLAHGTEYQTVISGLGAASLFNTHGPAEILAGNESELWQKYRQAQGEWSEGDETIWSGETRERLEQLEPWEQNVHARRLARKAQQLIMPGQSLHYLNLHLHFAEGVRQSMQLAHQEGIRVYTPYLDSHTLTLATSLAHHPDAQGSGKESLYTLLARHIPEIAQRPQHIPLRMPTAMFTPPLQSELVRELLSEQALSATGIFAEHAVQNLLQGEPTAERERRLLLIFTTQLMQRLFQMESL